jgi:hypothetical protein
MIARRAAARLRPTGHQHRQLGVWSRAQAIVFARDHGFGG